jgi:hypothetical protein
MQGSFFTSVIWPFRRAIAGMVMAWLALGQVLGPVQAQEVRDPTQAPPEAVASGSGAKPKANTLGLGSEGVTVLVRDGKPFLVVGTRLYAPGQKVGQYKIERITETEIWLQDGALLRKVPRFTGIVRSASATAPAAAASAPKVKPAKKIKKVSAP